MLGNKSQWPAVAAAGIILAGSVAAAADQGNLVPNTGIAGPALTFDWPAIEIGIGSYEEGPTGLTVIRFPKRASAVADSRGGSPGTVNSDALRLGYIDPSVDAVVFSGGSAYGEETITAVATGLKDNGIRSGEWGNVAFVPGAIIYDLGGRRLNEIYPDKRLAQAALQAMRPGVFPLGAQGAGRMATQGGFLGCNAHSGQGAAFRGVGPVKVAAFVVVNASGAVTDRDGRLASCNRAESWGGLSRTSDLLQRIPGILEADRAAPAASPEPGKSATKNTTVSLIVTNQKLDYPTLQRLAIQVHTSMARAIQPFSTESDGDTLYAASTQEVDGKDLKPDVLATLGGEVMWDAVLASVPDGAVSAPPGAPAAVGAEALAAYAGTYEFAAAPGQAGSGFSGLGLEVALGDGAAKVSPVEGGPAARAGVVAGDIVTALDGTPFQGVTLRDVFSRMRGPTGSKAELTITRANQDQPIKIVVTREPIRLRPLLRVQVQGGGLVVEAIGGRAVFEFERAKPIAVVASSDAEFFVAGRYRTRIAFTKDAAGRVSGAVLNPGRWEQKGLKVE